MSKEIISNNAPCPCGSGKKYKYCCLKKKGLEKEAQVIHVPEEPIKSFDIDSIKATNAPLLENVPNIMLATPWSNNQVSSGFCSSMVNMALAMPFPSLFGLYQARHTADARNIICMDAIEKGFTHIMMIDADQRFKDDLFIKLWKVLEEYGHDNTIASGWATIRGGPLEGNTSIVFAADKGVNKGLVVADKDGLPEKVFQAYTVGTPCLLFATSVLTKIQPPWFADLLVIDRALDIIEEADGEEGSVVYWPTERVMTHDFTFGIRMSEANVRIMVDPEAKLPHEVVEVI